MINFTMVDNEILEAKLSDGALRLYIVLSSYCFGDKSTCFPSQNTLAARLNKNVRTIQRYIGELIVSGLITKRRRGSISNEYQIVAKACKETAAKMKSIFNRKSSNKDSSASSAKHGSYAGFDTKPQSFSAYSQRNYDFGKLEDMLLGNGKNLSFEDCLVD